MSDSNDRAYWIEVHQHMSVIMDFFIERGPVPLAALEEYERLGVKPSHEHKSIADHKSAVYTLGEVMAEYTDESDAPEGMAVVMREMKEQFRENG